MWTSMSSPTSTVTTGGTGFNVPMHPPSEVMSLPCRYAPAGVQPGDAADVHHPVAVVGGTRSGSSDGSGVAAGRVVGAGLGAEVGSGVCVATTDVEHAATSTASSATRHADRAFTASI